MKNLLLKVELVKFKNLNNVFEKYLKWYDVEDLKGYCGVMEDWDIGNNISFDELRIILGNNISNDECVYGGKYEKYNLLMNKIIWNKLIKYGEKKYNIKNISKLINV